MVRRKKKFSLKEEYKSCAKYIGESKKFIYFAIGVFAFFFLMGLFIKPPEMLSQTILDLINELLKKTQDLGHLGLIKFIFFNNLQSSFYAMVFGVAFGIFPLFSAIMNGYILGFVSSAVIFEEGIFVLWRLLPHGIFELPAIFISMGLGLKLGSFIFYKEKMETLKNFLWNSLKVFVYVIIPLLIIAGIIEGTLIFLRI